MHEGLDRIGSDGPGESLVLALLALEEGNGQALAADPVIDLEHLEGVVVGFLFRLEKAVSFLPEEFAPPEEGAGRLFPADD